MNQSRRMSFIESLVNVAVGYGVAVASQVIVFPWFGIAITFADTLEIGLIFTGVSIVRSYALRRWFEWMRQMEISL